MLRTHLHPLLFAILGIGTFYTTMPGLALVQSALISSGILILDKVRYPLAPFDYAGAHPVLAVVALLIWHGSFQQVTATCRTSISLLMWIVLPLVLGKVYDMVLEGQSWTGTLWVVPSVIVMVVALWKRRAT